MLEDRLGYLLSRSEMWIVDRKRVTSRLQTCQAKFLKLSFTFGTEDFKEITAVIVNKLQPELLKRDSNEGYLRSMMLELAAL